ncbi:MAG: NADP oxidoreductase, partial [Bacteroidetes bacterium]|nr:NADP oxidoreductase [Bacteroidota bacterium]
MTNIENSVKEICGKYSKSPMRLMDILTEVQKEFRHIPCEAVNIISKELNLSKVDVEQTVSFYHFFTCKPLGKYAVYLNDSAVAKMMGRDEIAKTFEKEAGCKFGEKTGDDLIGLY